MFLVAKRHGHLLQQLPLQLFFCHIFLTIFAFCSFVGHAHQTEYVCSSVFTIFVPVCVYGILCVTMVALFTHMISC